MSEKTTALPRAATSWLAGGGEMGALMRAKDWAKSVLGPVETWSPALRTMTSILLANRFPMLLWWGPDSISIYNDAYIPVLGVKHPGALGLPVRECWSEIYDVLRPLILTPLSGGPPTWSEDLPLEIRRHGFLEETHWTVAYSPVPDETAPNGIGGVLATVYEITAQVIGQRRNALLRDLGARSGEARTAEEACATAASIIARYPRDVPFALIYLLDRDGRTARLAAAAGVDLGRPESPSLIDSTDESDAKGWPIAQAVRTRTAQLVEDLGCRFSSVPRGPWPDVPQRALVMPVESNLAHHPAGVLVVGLSPRLELDSYRGFIDLATAQLATAIANARAYEEERRRAESLAELDRAKTIFFSNVSHELRTPLTLMLGPVEDVLQDQVEQPSSGHREKLETAHRNALRLLKLVNSLLDFSRIEAGRIQASYEPTEIGSFTAEVASSFRSLTERAGLKLVIECPPVSEPVFVDRQMWEKIVLNLVSNAFKFTFEGEISVRVEADARCARLVVRDTGTGIDEKHLPHVFERFYRVEGARGRTYEGSGIGLALVRELVRLHGGSVSVESESGRGTTFTVTVPAGSAHLPLDRVQATHTLASTAVGAQAFVQEAAGWVGGTSEDAADAVSVEMERDEAASSTRLLVADDNADMRAYLGRLLRPLGTVKVVRDGQEALAAIGPWMPDLVLSDVMMPNLDGFGLVRALREDPSTRTLPIVLLSARAGEESRVEGARSGADDYIVKPFSARELVARVRSQLQLARQRRDHAEELLRSEERFRALVTASSDVIYRMSPDWREMRQLVGCNFITDTTDPSSTWLDKYIHPDDRPRVMAVIDEAIRTKSTFQLEHRVLRVDGTLGWTFSRAIPLLDANGAITEWFGAASDITERKRAEEELRKTSAALQAISASTPVLVALKDRDSRIVLANPAVIELIGRPLDEVYGHNDLDWFGPEVGGRILENDRRVMSTLTTESVEETTPGGRVWLSTKTPWRDAQGNVRGVAVVSHEITERKAAEQALREADRRKDEFLGMLSHELRNPLAPIRNSTYVLRHAEPGSDQARRAQSVIERQIQHLTRLVDDLLDVTRIARGKIELHRERVDLRDVVRRTAEDLRSVIESRGVAFRVDVPEANVWAEVDQTRVAQAIGNLLQNAAKFTRAGDSVRLSLECEGTNAQIRVEDTGVGIEETLLPSVFDAFVQGERTLARTDGGLGLGLALVKGIAELHGGMASARSAGIGQGAELTLSLKVAAPSPKEQPAVARAPLRLSGRRVLVVDDNVDAAESLAEALRLAGHEVDVAFDGSSAIDKVRLDPPDVVLCDVGLPGMSGYEVARTLRASGANRMQLIALSGYAQPEDVRKAVESGFDGHVAKPCDLEEIERLLA